MWSTAVNFTMMRRSSEEAAVRFRLGVRFKHTTTVTTARFRSIGSGLERVTNQYQSKRESMRINPFFIDSHATTQHTRPSYDALVIASRRRDVTSQANVTQPPRRHQLAYSNTMGKRVGSSASMRRLGMTFLRASYMLALSFNVNLEVQHSLHGSPDGASRIEPVRRSPRVPLP